MDGASTVVSRAIGAVELVKRLALDHVGELGADAAEGLLLLHDEDAVRLSHGARTASMSSGRMERRSTTSAETLCSCWSRLAAARDWMAGLP